MVSKQDVGPEGHEKKHGVVNEKVGAAKEKVGHALHMHKTEAKGAAQKAEGQSTYDSQTAKQHGAGAKDSLVGKGKEVIGAATGNEQLKAKGQAQESKGDTQRDVTNN